MKILHIDMTGPYTVGATYQENCLPAEQVKLGHEVVFWGTAYEWYEGKVRYVGELRQELPDGVILQRIDYVRFINSFLTKKIRLCSNIYERLCKENPELIMVHDGQTACVPDICRFVKNHRNTRLIADSHCDYYNSARNVASKYILHKMYYKRFMSRLYDSVEKLYCISPEVKENIIKLYNLPSEKMEILPLGGEILEDTLYEAYRTSVREELKIPEDGVCIIHSGKMSIQKKSDYVIDAVDSFVDRNVYFIFVGAVSDEIRDELEKKMAHNDHIVYAGWRSGEELIRFLCAGDIYLLPAAQSATVQSAMCNRCAIEVFPYENYKSFGQNELCYSSNYKQLINNLKTICEDGELLAAIREESFEYARHFLDYSYQAKIILN